MGHTSGLIFRTAGSWGPGKGSNLIPAEIDQNFDNVDERLDTLETNPPTPVEISSISVTGASMTVNMADGSKFGPFTLPTAAFVFRGDWAPLTQYFENDVFFEPGDGIFLVLTDFESATAFDPGGAEIAKLLPDAARWFTGSGVPSSSLGNENDLYLDTANGDVYENQGTPGWAQIANLTGPTGPAPATLDDVGDVDYGTPGPADGDVLVRRGGGWVPEAGVGRQTIWMPAAALQPTVTAGAGDHITQGGLTTVELTAGRPNITYLPFETATKQNAQFSISMPKSWDLGTFTYEAMYSHAGGQTGGLDGVAWGLSGVAVGDGETVDVVFGTEVVVTKDASAADSEHKTAESAAVTAAGAIAAGDTVYFNLARVVADAADDLDVDARLHGIKLFYSTNALTDD